jgi:hypothetical protein
VVGSLPDELVVDGTLKSDAVCVVPLVAAATVGVASAVVLVLLGLLLVEVVVLAVVLAAVVGAVGDASKLKPLAVVPADKLADEIDALFDVAAAPSVANSPEFVAVADGLDPAVTVKVVVPSLDCSHGKPDAAGPPSRLAPIT